MTSRAADHLEQSAAPDAGEAATMTELVISAEGARVTSYRGMQSRSIPARLKDRLRKARGIGEAQFVAAGHLNQAKQAELLG